MTKTLTLRGDRWVEHVGVDGWEPFTILTRAEKIDGEMRLIGVQVLPREDVKVADLGVLTANRLRALPISTLMKQHRQAMGLDFMAWASVAVTARPRGGDTNHARRVAEVYRRAEEGGHPPRPAVAEAFGVSLPTADRWIRDARDRGVLKPYNRGAKRG